ncbi:MAG: MBL fold metallo-hydrolase [Candidatus Woesearchaeota archaeon]|jgi:putative mRNA 3-end processing factor
MEIVFHGAAGEVGRSCIEIDNSFLLDAGLKITEKGTEYPTYLDTKKIQAVFISHAHLDHTGALPIFNHEGLSCSIYATHMTKLTTEVLLNDSFHIELITHSHAGYSKENIFTVLQHFHDVSYDEQISISKDLSAQYLDAGHIPGSSSILLNYKRKKILYTGDINWKSTQLIAGAHYTANPDIMISESTYGDRLHPNRQESEKQFIEAIKDVLNKGGSILLPAFAVGRAQELMILLTKSGIDCPIFLDGMAKKITELCITNSSFVKSFKELQDAHKKVQPIVSENDRKRIMHEKCIIITTSGMVTGGPVMEYLKMMFFEPKHAIFLTGYQGEGTNGRLLLQERCAYIDGKKVQWTGRIEQYDFSAHAGQDDLIEAVQRMKPKVLILNHGDDVALAAFADKIKRIVPSVIIAKLNEKIVVN